MGMAAFFDLRGNGMIYNSGTFEEKDKVWFVGDLDNYLYCMDKKSMETSIVALIPHLNDKDNPYRANSICKKYENNIICFPDKSKDIQIYNIIDKSFDSINIDLDVKRLGIYNGWVYNGKIWCVTYSSGKLIKCDIETKKVEKIYNVCDSDGISNAGEAVKNGELLYFISKMNCKIIEFNMQNENIKEYNISCKDKGFGTILVDGNNIYLTGFENCIYKWNKKNNMVEIIDLKGKITFTETNVRKESVRFFHSYLINDYILFVPQNNFAFVCEEVIILDKKNKVVKTYNFRCEGAERMPGEYLVYNFSIQNKLYIQDYKRNDFVVLDLQTEIYTHEIMKINKKKNTEFWRNNGISGLKRENEVITLEGFIAGI